MKHKNDNDKTSILKDRPRGRPQVRADAETKAVIVEAANTQFHANRYTGSSMSAIAQTAGVSTKTLYRLFPTKNELFTEVINSRIDRFFSALDPDTLRSLDVAAGLERLLVCYGGLTLSDDAVMITRLVIGESDRFPMIAASFYEQVVVRTNNLIAGWLTTWRDDGLLNLADPTAAAGILRGMMTMEPQRAAILRQRSTLGTDEISDRAKMCAQIFLSGCRVR